MREFGVTEKTVCNLISSALFDNALILPDDLDWRAVYQEIQSHAILGVFRDVIPSLNLPQAIKTEWEKQNYSIIAKGIRIGAGQREIIQLLSENGISYAILKGTAAAQYYPLKYSRSLGDVDFIVKEEDYEKTQQLLADNGYLRAFEHEDNYRHESFIKDKIPYECHHLFADRCFSHAAAIDHLIVSHIELAAEVETEYGRFMCLPTAINGLVLLEHIAIHIKDGLGLRQILDWLLFAKQNLNDEGWIGQNGAIIRESGLDTLAKVITRVGQLYLGLNSDITWCADAPEDVCAKLIRLVFSYGNFGNKNTIDDEVVEVAQRLRSGVFINLKMLGEHNWKALHKYPWLKPLAPVYQIGRYIKRVITRKGALKALIGKKKAIDDREHFLKELGI